MTEDHFTNGGPVIQSCNNGSFWGGYEEYNVSLGNTNGNKPGHENCGYCGKTCRDNRDICKNGKCGETCDGIEEIDTTSDSYYCGSCLGEDKTCDGKACVDGKCEGTDLFNVTCKGVSGINLSEDSANCGKCGNVLMPIDKEDGTRVLQICKDGNPKEVALSITKDSETTCNGKPARLADDQLNCGSCGDACGNMKQCIAGACIDMSTVFNVPEKPENNDKFLTFACGFVKTGDTYYMNLALPQIDANNCGMCGKKCGVGEYCKDGKCTPIDENTHAVSYCGTKKATQANANRWLSTKANGGQTIQKYKNAVDYKHKGAYYIYDVNAWMKENYCDYFNDVISNYNIEHRTLSSEQVTGSFTGSSFFPTLAFDRENCGQCGNKCDEKKKPYCVHGNCISRDEFRDKYYCW